MTTKHESAGREASKALRAKRTSDPSWDWPHPNSTLGRLSPQQQRAVRRRKSEWDREAKDRERSWRAM